MINSNTSFGKLREVIVGRELSLTKRLSDIAFKQFYREELDEKIYESLDEYNINQDIIEERNQDLDTMANQLTKMGVVVHRPEPLTKIIQFSTPHFKSEMSSASNVRDLTFIYRDKIIETPTFVRNRYYENMLLHDIFNKAYDRGHGGQWLRCPHTELTEETMDLQNWRDVRDYEQYDRNRYVMAVDGAQFLKIGKDVIVNINSYNQYTGYEWVKSFFPESNFHILHVADNHIDGVLICLKPGMFLVNPKYPNIKSILPAKFKSWKFLYPADITAEIDVTGLTDVDLRLASSRGMDINILSLDETTVMVNRRATGVKAILDKNGFDVFETKLEHGEIFAGGIHCSTLDIVREDDYISY